MLRITKNRNAKSAKVYYSIGDVTDEQLSPRTKNNSHVGCDFHFHVPKSVSLLHVLTDDTTLLEAFRTSVSDTMKEVEADFQGSESRKRPDVAFIFRHQVLGLAEMPKSPRSRPGRK